MGKEKQEHKMRRERRENWQKSGLSWYDFMSRGHRQRRASREARAQIPMKPMPMPRVSRGTSHVGSPRGHLLLRLDSGRLLRFNDKKKRRAFERAFLL